MDRLDGVYDIVVIVTSQELKDIPYSELSEQLDSLFDKANVYKTL